MFKSNKLPKAILLVDDIKANSLKYEKEYKRSEDISILSIKEAQELQLDIPGGFKKNEIFFLNPFQEGVYLPVDTDKLSLQKFKLNSLFQLAKYLGASRFEANLVYHEEESSETKGGTVLETPYGGVEGSIKADNKKLLEMGLKMVRNIKKAENVEYVKAIAYASKYGLTNDTDIYQFIQSRSPDDESILTDDSFSVTTSTEINKSLDWALSLNAFAKTLKLNTKHSSASFKKEIITLQIDIVF